MIHIFEITNSVFNSKTYILYQEGESTAWMVDVGDADPLFAFLDEHNLSVKGIFLTHTHFDHIYGLKPLLTRFPSCSIYTTQYGKIGLASDKINMSKYYDAIEPIAYDGNNVIIVREGDTVPLFDEEPSLLFFETPGHNPGCLTMVIGDMIFTGDSYIPGIGVTTNIRYAEKEKAQLSLLKIMKLAEGKRIFSGHNI